MAGVEEIDMRISVIPGNEIRVFDTFFRDIRMQISRGSNDTVFSDHFTDRREDISADVIRGIGLCGAVQSDEYTIQRQTGFQAGKSFGHKIVHNFMLDGSTALRGHRNQRHDLRSAGFVDRGKHTGDFQRRPAELEHIRSFIESYFLVIRQFCFDRVKGIRLLMKFANGDLHYIFTPLFFS